MCIKCVCVSKQKLNGAQANDERVYIINSCNSCSTNFSLLFIGGSAAINITLPPLMTYIITSLLFTHK